MKIVFMVTGVLMVMVILSVGCANTKPASVPAASTTQNVTGILKDLNTPSDPGKDVVVVQTPQGEQIIPITANTTYSIEGKTCFLAEVGKAVDEGNVTYECTVVLTGLDPYGGEESARAVYVTKKK